MKLEERRALYRKGLSSLYLPYYDTLCTLLGPEWQPYCGLRTFDEQTALYAQGRVTGKPGAVVTWAKSGESPHNYGCASDWTLWDIPSAKPQWMTWKDDRWKEYQAMCEKAGLRWGGDWNMNGSSTDEAKHDAVHNELPITCSWKHVSVAYSQGGLVKAFEHIEGNLVKK